MHVDDIGCLQVGPDYVRLKNRFEVPNGTREITGDLSLCRA